VTLDRVEPTLFDDAADWAVDERAARRDRFQVDALAEQDFVVGADTPGGATEPRPTPPPAKGRGSAKTARLRDDILRNAAWYDQHGKHQAADRARVIAERLR
jgi:hypothetical protein